MFSASFSPRQGFEQTRQQQLSIGFDGRGIHSELIALDQLFFHRRLGHRVSSVEHIRAARERRVWW